MRSVPGESPRSYVSRIGFTGRLDETQLAGYVLTTFLAGSIGIHSPSMEYGDTTLEIFWCRFTSTANSDSTTIQSDIRFTRRIVAAVEERSQSGSFSFLQQNSSANDGKASHESGVKFQTVISQKRLEITITTC